MKITIIVVIEYILLILTKSIRDVSISLSDNGVYRESNVNFTFTTEYSIDSGAVLHISFPDGFNVDNIQDSFIQLSGFSTTRSLEMYQDQTIYTITDSNINANTLISFTVGPVTNPKYSGITEDFSIIFQNFLNANILDKSNGNTTVTLLSSQLIGTLQCLPDGTSSTFITMIKIIPTIPITQNDIIMISQINTTSLTDDQLFNFNSITAVNSHLLSNESQLSWQIYSKDQLYFEIEYLTDYSINSLFNINVSYGQTPNVPQTYYFKISIYTIINYNNNDEKRLTQSVLLSNLIASVPDPPTNIQASELASEAIQITFDIPSFNGLSEITSYTAKPYDVGDDSQISATNTGSPIYMMGLTNGESYYIQVVANNRIGSSEPGISSEQVTPATVPDKPTILSINELSVGNKVNVIIEAGAFNGGSTLTQWTIYSYTLFESNLILEKTDIFNYNDDIINITIGVLSNGIEYYFTATTSNKMGESSESSTFGPAIPSTTPSLEINNVYSINESCIFIDYNVNYRGATIYDLSITGIIDLVLNSDSDSNINNVSTIISQNIEGDNYNQTYIWCNQLTTYKLYNIMLSATNYVGTTSTVWNEIICLLTVPETPLMDSVLRSSEYSTNATIFLSQPNVNYCLQTQYCKCTDVSAAVNVLKANSSNLTVMPVSNLNIGRNFLTIVCKNQVGWSIETEYKLIHVATFNPTHSPTSNPTMYPSMTPTQPPTRSPTMNPSISPTISPSANPTYNPTKTPTDAPVINPTNAPSYQPTNIPTDSPLNQAGNVSISSTDDTDTSSSDSTTSTTSVVTTTATNPASDSSDSPESSEITTSITMITTNFNESNNITGGTGSNNNNDDGISLGFFNISSSMMPVFYTSLCVFFCIFMCLICCCKRKCCDSKKDFDDDDDDENSEQNQFNNDSDDNDEQESLNNSNTTQSDIVVDGESDDIDDIDDVDDVEGQIPTKLNNYNNNNDDFDNFPNVSEILDDEQYKQNENENNNFLKRSFTNVAKAAASFKRGLKKDDIDDELSFDQIELSPPREDISNNNHHHNKKVSAISTSLERMKLYTAKEQENKIKNVSPTGTICIAENAFVDDIHV